MDNGWTSKAEGASTSALRLMMLLVFVALLVAAGTSGGSGPAVPLAVRGETEENDKELQKLVPDLKVAAEGGSFTLSNLQLVKVLGSTKLKGQISNETARAWNRLIFEVKAFDAQGNQLKGAEEITILQVNDFDETAAMPIDGGYGVWLEGIPFASISRVEAVLVEGRMAASYKFKMKQPVASDDLVFEDEAVRMSFDIDAEGIRLLFAKKMGAEVEVDWDRMRIIDASGKARAVEHFEAPLHHGLRASLFDIVLPEAVTLGTLRPKDRVDESRPDGARDISTLLPEGTEAINYKGKLIQLRVPVNINGVRRSYYFGFQITEVEAKTFRLPDARYQLLFETPPERRRTPDMEE
jgi:hypothetical protein